MNILYCGDRGIEDGVLISALSLARRLPSNVSLRVHLLTFDYQNSDRHFLPITERFRSGLERTLRAVKSQKNTSVRLFDITELFAGCPPTANENSRFTPGCMLRLFADQVPDLPDRILYLDNDVVALGDPTDFYHTELKNRELAGVLDNYGSHFFQRGCGRSREYLNSGVLLLNLAVIRQTGLFAKARELCQKEKMFMPDQTSLNRLCKAKVFADRRYNEQAATRPDTVLRHFTTTFQPLPYPHPQTIKPWHIDKLHRKLKEHSFDDILTLYQSKIKEFKDE